MSSTSLHANGNDFEFLANATGRSLVADEEKAIGGNEDSEKGCDVEKDPKEGEVKDPNLVSNIWYGLNASLHPPVHPADRTGPSNLHGHYVRPELPRAFHLLRALYIRIRRFRQLQRPKLHFYCRWLFLSAHRAPHLG